MLERSDTSISETLKRFNAFELEVGLLVPTPTGLKKSIIDATESVRDFLRDSGFHDYAQQKQGGEGKLTRPAYYVFADRIEETQVSLYRPETKNGDPRLWFSRMRHYVEPYNLVALLIQDGSLYVVNCSKPEILGSLSNRDTPLGSLAARTSKGVAPEVQELLEKIREISQRGYVRTMRPGDTGVGMTLEHLLGIAANSSKSPDYKGIEIKAKRLKERKPTRITLFSQAPNWKLSPIGSAWNLLKQFGYVRSGKLRLNHEINTLAPNSLGFQLEVDAANGWLKQVHMNPMTAVKQDVVTWEMETLRRRLVEKHPQTFWVGAQCRGRGPDEEFHYTKVEVTRAPRVKNLDALLEGGLISVDYLMSQKDPKKQAVRDHGYLFKIHVADLGALFPPSEVYYF